MSKSKNDGLIYCIYMGIKKAGVLPAFLSFMKITAFHVCFEVLLTVSLASFIMLYIPGFAIYENAPLPISEYFIYALIYGGLVYCSISAVFVFLCFLLFSFLMRKQTDYTKVKPYKSFVNGCISIGLFMYVVIAYLTARKPNWFIMVENLTLPDESKVWLFVIISVMGSAWALLTYFRFERLDVLCDNGKIKPVDYQVNKEIVNGRTLKYTIISFISQAIVIVILGFGFVSVFFTRAEIFRNEEYDYLYLLMAFFFGLISTYLTFCLKYEYKEKTPGFIISVEETSLDVKPDEKTRVNKKPNKRA